MYSISAAMMIRGFLLLRFVATLQAISINDFLCVENALLQSSNECNEYYICINGENVLRECPDDLHFDPILNKCDSPDRVGCGHNSIDSHEDNKLIRKHDKNKEKQNKCSKKKYKKEKHGKEKHTKDKHSNDKYSKDKVFKEKRIRVKYYKERHSKKKNYKSITEENCEEKPERYSSTKVYSETKTTQYPIETTSINYNPNATTDVQITTEYSTTENRTNLTTESSTTNDLNALTTKTESTSSIISSTISNLTISTTENILDKCISNKLGEALYIPHVDCGKYYMCVGNILIEMSCPAGLHFNSVLNVCDYPVNANCARTTALQVTMTSALSTSSNSETTKTTKTATTHRPIRQCRSNKPGEVEFAPHSYCGKYYICKDDRLIEMTCPNELHFNPVLNICDYPEHANCNRNTSTMGPNSTEENISTSKPISSEGPIISEKPFPSVTEDIDITNKPNSSCRANIPGEIELASHPDCNRYYICEDHRLIEMTCPAGLHFNPVLNVCDYPEHANCREIITTKEAMPTDESNLNSTVLPKTVGTETTFTPIKECRDGELEFAPHLDCGKYYVCGDNSLIEMSCPAGLHFNSVLNVCDYPEYANCNDNTSVSTDSYTLSSSKTPSSTFSEESLITGKTVSNTTEEIKTTNKPNNNCRANNSGDVEFAPHQNCGKYYICKGDKLIEMNCSVGLHFNPSLNVCDYPEQSKCDGSSALTLQVSTGESSL